MERRDDRRRAQKKGPLAFIRITLYKHVQPYRALTCRERQTMRKQPHSLRDAHAAIAVGVSPGSRTETLLVYTYPLSGASLRGIAVTTRRDISTKRTSRTLDDSAPGPGCDCPRFRMHTHIQSTHASQLLCTSHDNAHSNG